MIEITSHRRPTGRRIAGSLAVVGALLVLPSRMEAAPVQNARDQVASNVNAPRARQALARIRADAGALRTAIEQTMPRGRATGNPRAAQNQEILYLVDGVVQAADDLNRQLGRAQPTRYDIDDLLSHAAELEDAMSGSQLRPAVNAGWARLRGSLGTLASAYGVDGDWRNPQFRGVAGRPGSQRFGGTYRLSPTGSDNPDAIAERALRGLSGPERSRMARQLQNRLTPPEAIAIDRDGSRVTIVSSVGRQTTFEADGRPRTEAGPAGRVVTTRATLRADELEVSTSGSGNSDYSVTFEPFDAGQSMRVTRRLYNDALREPIIVRSVYRRESDVANWNVYEGRGAGVRDGREMPPSFGRDELTVPSGTTFVASLDRALNVRNAREGDSISLRVVDGPTQFRNATIEGYVTAEPQRASSRPGLSLAFERIRMADGRAGTFSGTIESVRDSSGRNIAFDRAEAQDQDDRSDQAIQRGAIGAAVGAILGAVVGGGKGAGIGAVLGAGGGAGTVLLDNQSQQQLPRGTEFTIRSDTFNAR